ncbi:MAG: c-type cytochrome [Xanthomonadaceae bacterium]|nr:c-type cytochrome [Xanthomonadaceae bacterium]
MAPPARLGLCAACHGSNGIATLPGVPNLAGQRLDYLRQALADYRSGRRDVAPMRAATGPLSTRELDQLAAWYASRPPCAPAAKR